MIWSLSSFFFFIFSSLSYYLLKKKRKERFFFFFLMWRRVTSFLSLVDFFNLYKTLLIPFNEPLFILSLSLGVPRILRVFQKIYIKKSSILISSTCFLFIIILIIFSCESLGSFFVFFEISVIPVVAIIFLGGSSKIKTEASLYLFFFTSFSGFFLFFFSLVFSFKNQGDLILVSLKTTQEFYLTSIRFDNYLNTVINFLFFFSLFVKMPVFFLHMWLPKAHVEAPVFGSMVLARVVLKLGGFGFILISNFFSRVELMVILIFFFSLGCVISGVSCYGQKDLKSIIALSRVNHISLFSLGVLRLRRQSIWGGILLILGHGVISSLIFFIRRINYNSTSSRRIFFSKNLGSDYTYLIFWITIILINAGLPPFLNFLGEIRLIKNFFRNIYFFIILALNFLGVGLYRVLILRHLSEGKENKKRNRLIGKIRDWVVFIICYLHLSSFLYLHNLWFIYG